MSSQQPSLGLWALSLVLLLGYWVLMVILWIAFSPRGGGWWDHLLALMGVGLFFAAMPVTYELCRALVASSRRIQVISIAHPILFVAPLSIAVSVGFMWHGDFDHSSHWKMLTFGATGIVQALLVWNYQLYIREPVSKPAAGS